MKSKTLKQINKALLSALYQLFNGHINNLGNIEYKEKDYGYISDELDYAEIKYNGKEPDGDYQEELATDGDPMASDYEMFVNMVARFGNTYAWVNAEKGGKSDLLKVNRKLYKVMNDLILVHPVNGGTLKFSSSDRKTMNKTIDKIEMCYFKMDALSAEQDVLKNTCTLNDEKAYELLSECLYNVRIKHPEEGHKFAERCDITGEGMNEGWVIDGDAKDPKTGKYIGHVKYEKDAKKVAKLMGYKSIADAYKTEDEHEESAMYWTSWEGQGDEEYIVKNGRLIEIE